MSPCQPVTPSSVASPTDLLELILPHALTPRDPDSIAALSQLLAPNAAINHSPTARGLQAALATLPEPATLAGIDHVESSTTADTFTWSARLHFADNTRSTFRLTLGRGDAGEWQVTTLSHNTS